ncbi:MAG: RES family NAD+ phosphorylase [Rudanella sp.]|nr:RES family NAD+ phosphorylase [Rudanella sp.]
MTVYRLSNLRRADDLSGAGARMGGGRWNKIGVSVLYTASSRALASLELMVHTTSIDLPNYYVMLMLIIPEDSMQTVSLDQLPMGWNESEPPESIKAITEIWIAENRFLVLKVPSAVVTGDYNFLLNPAHPRMVEVKIIEKQPFRFDHRLTRP